MTEAREKSIKILENIAGYLTDKGLAKEEIFDCKNGNTTWYDLEDLITKIIK